MRPLGFSPSRKNPRLCSECFERAPMGGVEMDVGVLFADVRGFTALSEDQAPDDVAELLNRFYATAVEVLCRHAIIDKLVGDQVMALYLPQLFGGEAAEHMLGRRPPARRRDAEPPGRARHRPRLRHAYVGNVGAGEVKDFTAIGDVVNTAARLRASRRADQIVASRRVVDGPTGDGVAQDFVLKGKSEPVPATVITPVAPG